MSLVRAGSGPALVFVHGFLSGASYWENQIEELSKSFEVIAFDHPGYGDKTDELGFDNIADFAENVLKTLDGIGISHFHLLGHSMGGMIAQEIALKVPSRVDRLMLYGTGPRGDMPGRFEPLEVSMDKVEREGASEAKGYTVASWFKNRENDPNFEPGMAMAEKVSDETFVNALRAMAGWSAMARLSQIKSDTLVIWADLDRSYTWELQPYVLWKEITNASLAVMPGCSHNAHLENPDLFNKLLLDFLS